MFTRSGKQYKEVEQSITLLAERELCEKQLQDERTEEAAKREEELNEECRRSEEEAAKPEEELHEERCQRDEEMRVREDEMRRPMELLKRTC